MFTEMAPLPDKLGFAGMFAGVMNDKIFCMGGANFPDKMPWEKGIKKWYDGIFMFDGKNWVQRSEKLPMPLGYGVSGSYKNKMIIVGGNNADGFYNKVYQLKLIRNKIKITDLPSLSIPVAFTTGTVLNNLLIVAGGDSSATGKPLKKCLALDLENTKAGWFELDPWPGDARHFPVCGVYNDHFYFFSGETIQIGNDSSNRRVILDDAYSLKITQSRNKYNAEWAKLSGMPKGISAAPSPAPYLKDIGFVFWGGVDAVTALYTDAATHMGINSYVISYDPVKDAWSTIKREDKFLSRVGAPAVFYKGNWVYISGEVKPGIRTNKVVSLQ